MRIEALCPLHIRRAAADLHVLPGGLIDLPEEEAVTLLQKAAGKVRVVPSGEIAVEPVTKPDGSPLTPVYWERGDGSILGPASVELFYRMGPSDGLIVKFRGDLLWINTCTLRSQRQWTEQKPVIEVDRRLLKA